MPFSIHSFQQNGFDIIALKEEDTGTQVEIVPAFGAMLYAFKVRHRAQLLNVIESYESLQEYRQQAGAFRGVKLSPYACRIPGGRYNWQQQDYEIQKSVLPGHAVHGLLYDMPFTIEEQHAGDHEASVILQHAYTGHDTGYPFPYDCRVQYRLLAGNRLELQTTLVNRASRAIPVMDGWHPYFTTGSPVDELELQFASDQMVEFNEQLVPTGRLLVCTDFRQSRSLRGIALDNSFLLDFAQPLPLCTLRDPRKGIALAFYPDESYPVLQVYIPSHRNSIAIENLSGAPNAFNNRIGLNTLEADTPKTFSTAVQVQLA